MVWVQGEVMDKDTRGFLASLAKDMCLLFRDYVKHERHNQEDHGNWADGGSPDKEPPTTEARLLDRTASRLSYETIAKEGFTYDPVHKNSPTKGFSVSGYPDRELRIKPKELDAGVIDRFLSKNKDIFAKDKLAHLGGWYDKGGTGDVFLDIVTVAKTKEQAYDLAVKHKELAFYDLKTGETISVEGPKKESYVDYKRRMRIQHIKEGRVKAEPGELEALEGAVKKKEKKKRFKHFLFPQGISAKEAAESIQKLTEK
jgi:hypothetical protein